MLTERYFGCPRCRTETIQLFYKENGFFIQECSICHRKRKQIQDDTGSNTFENIDKDIYDHYQEWLKHQEKSTDEEKG